MISKELSLRRIYICTGVGIFTTGIIFLVSIFLLTHNKILVFAGAIFTLVQFVWAVLFTALLKKKLTQFTTNICHSLDLMISDAGQPEFIPYEETLLAKINHRLDRLYEVNYEKRRSVNNEKIALQELISDISHQTKTPVANLKIIYSIILEQDLTEEKRMEFLQSMAGQLDKLTFLMQAMIKTSRLETGVIVLEKKKCLLYETLAEALGSIILQAEEKNITVTVNCDTNLIISHDRKWTSEALFNILDNAVKYTHIGGKIDVSVTKWEMYTKIDIADNGKGISESHQAKIFTRFYREEEVHDVQGIGIGLYIVRKIITMQGGYIKVSSEAGNGATFSVFLLNE